MGKLNNWADGYPLHLVAIYSKALSAAEVSQNYSAGTAQPTPTPTATPVASPTATPTATPTNPPPDPVVIQRTTYAVAGQTIAVRVSGDPVAANNGLHYLYSDHLGSNSAMQAPDGTITHTRYEPFGAYRGGSGGNAITDRGFTGHKQNDSLGLIYMNARFYVSGIGRFASADTIVPDPADPQSLNRYTYVLNSPLSFTDPSGRCGADATGYEDEDWAIYGECVAARSELEGMLGNSVDGVWSLAQMQSFLSGAIGVQEQGIGLNGGLDADGRRSALQGFVRSLAGTNLTSLEISALAVEFASILGGDIEDSIAVLSGHEGSGVVIESCGFLCIDDVRPSNSGPYTTVDDLRDRESGFNAFYGDPDPDNNQVHHTWYWLQVGYYNNDIVGYVGNYYHEYRQETDGQSIEDYRAGLWGIMIADPLRNGEISLRDLPNILRRDLGE